jgi:N-acetylneuraminic acid mutarotase
MLYFQTLFASGQKKATARFKWSEAAILPAPDGLNRSLGVAGPVQGVSNGVLVVAGGSNFPGKMPWDGGKKVYYSKVYILEYSSGKYIWNDK